MKNIQWSLLRQHCTSIQGFRGRRTSTSYLECLQDNPNEETRQLVIPPDMERRLKQQWPTDRLNVSLYLFYVRAVAGLLLPRVYCQTVYL